MTRMKEMNKEKQHKKETTKNENANSKPITNKRKNKKCEM